LDAAARTRRSSRGRVVARVELLACEFLGALGGPASGPQETDGALSQALVELVAQIEAAPWHPVTRAS
jgi:hypothetical protein